jgi:hypothetical protein
MIKRASQTLSSVIPNELPNMHKLEYPGEFFLYIRLCPPKRGTYKMGVVRKGEVKLLLKRYFKWLTVAKNLMKFAQKV